jgi:hypothetical protein
VLVGPIDCAVDAVPLVVAIRLHSFEHSLPLTRFRPAIEAIEHRLPRSELVGQIAPWHAGSPPPQHGFDEVSIVLPGAS